ncbi:hypothetical protein [Kozakia baliensis]|uniref:hypothetical protein n=1 Tax=Kozakia baliensis TaxID=153496 RepID=UPI00087D852E|nr:hypothetical protein [Kozakia baliensis]AOX20722.1 hypothetical protein A0U90_11005 [Kozakia baliensis]
MAGEAAGDGEDGFAVLVAFDAALANDVADAFASSNAAFAVLADAAAVVPMFDRDAFVLAADTAIASSEDCKPAVAVDAPPILDAADVIPDDAR